MSHSILVTSNRVEGQLVPDDSSRSVRVERPRVGLADMEQSFTEMMNILHNHHSHQNHQNHVIARELSANEREIGETHSREDLMGLCLSLFLRWL
jgi:hypothetical protein